MDLKKIVRQLYEFDVQLERPLRKQMFEIWSNLQAYLEHCDLSGKELDDQMNSYKRAFYECPRIVQHALVNMASEWGRDDMIEFEGAIELAYFLSLRRRERT